jgi:hypothetical protein
MNAEGQVALNYLGAAAWVALLFGLAWLSAFLAHRFVPVLVGNVARALSFLLGSGLLLVATIGGLGWAIQSFGGNTPAELLNQSLFRRLSLSGAFLLIYDFWAARRSSAVSNG